MIQYGLDLEVTQSGFFTFEESIIGLNLHEIEDTLGFQKGRLKQGADIYLLDSPLRISDFDIMATTLFPGHQFEKSNLIKSVNTESNKQKHLGWFRRKKLVKVVPLQIHMEAMRKYLTPEEYALVRDFNPKGVDFKKFKYNLLSRFQNHPETQAKIKKDLSQRRDILRRDSINDKLYPSSTRGHVYQWSLNCETPARYVCRLVDYTEDKYHR